MAFRASGKAFFITYPQCPLTPKLIAQHIKNLHLTDYIIATREQHEDGRPHIHVFAIFVDKQNIKRQNHFDIQDYHPNVQTARDRKAIKEYILKTEPQGEDIFEFGEFILDVREKKASAWKQALEATTEEDCLRLIAEASPRDYIIQNDRIRTFSRTKRAKLSEYSSEFQNFSVPDALQNYITGEFLKKVSCVSSGHSRDRSSQFATLNINKPIA